MRLWKTCALLLLFLTPAFAQPNFPEKSVRLIVGYSPGSAPDIVARLIGERLADHWGKPVVVENITGGEGISQRSAWRKRRPMATPCC